MLFHVLTMISDLQTILPAFFAEHGARHVHISGDPWLGVLRAASKHLVVTVQYR